MNDLGTILEDIRKSERWRNWLAVGFIGGFGVLLDVLCIAAPPKTLGETLGLAGFGLLCIAIGAMFVVRASKAKEQFARVAQLIQQGEVQTILKQEGAYKGQRFWNFFVFTRGGDKTRVPVFRAHQYDALMQRLPPQLIQPWTRAKWKEMKTIAAA
jgi:hypothetical protein